MELRQWNGFSFIVLYGALNAGIRRHDVANIDIIYTFQLCDLKQAK